MSDLNEEEIFRLGMKAGAVFVDKVNALFKEFMENYEAADPNFDNEVYRDGFWHEFMDNVGVDIE